MLGDDCTPSSVLINNNSQQQSKRVYPAKACAWAPANRLYDDDACEQTVNRRSTATGVVRRAIGHVLFASGVPVDGKCSWRLVTWSHRSKAERNRPEAMAPLRRRRIDRLEVGNSELDPLTDRKSELDPRPQTAEMARYDG